MKRKPSKHELLKRKFMKFLYDNDALEAWNKARKADSEPARKFWKRPSKYWIAEAFIYINTDEGCKYWEDLSMKWHMKWHEINS